MSSVLLLQTQIDRVLVPLGFSPCDGGVTDGTGQMLWCTGAGEFAARFPALPVSEEPPKGWRTMCTDVSVRVGNGGRVIRVDVEGYDLDGLLTGLGLVISGRHAAGLIGSPVVDCVVSLPTLLQELLDNSCGQW